MKEEHFEKPVENSRSIPASITVEIGSGLVYLLENNENDSLISSVNELRNTLAEEWGIQIPLISVRENSKLEKDAYRLLMFNKELIKRKVEPGKNLLYVREDTIHQMHLESYLDPIYNRPCIWIEKNDGDNWKPAETSILTIENIILRHLEVVLRTNAKDLVTTEVVMEKLKPLYLMEPGTVQETLKKVSFNGLVQVLRNLVSEGIPLTRLDGIIRTIATTRVAINDPDSVAEQLRNILRENIHEYAFKDGPILFAVPDSKLLLWLFTHIRAHRNIPETDPVAQLLIKELTNLHLAFQAKGFRIGIICTGSTRLAIRRILEAKLPDLIVLKPEEILHKQEITVIRKIRAAGFKIKASWYWFWISASAARKKRFKEELNTLLDFLNKHLNALKKPEIKLNKNTLPPPLKFDFSPKKQEQKISEHHIPVIKAISGLQKAAAMLLCCNDRQVKNILATLERREIIAVIEEMGQIAVNSGNTGSLDCPDAKSMLLTEKRTEEIINLVKDAIEKEPDISRFTPLQKLAVFLSALSPGTAERMYSLILTGMSRDEIESLSKTNKNRQVIPLQKARGRIIEDFIWFLKGNNVIGAPYSRHYWNTELRNIAIRSSKKLAASLHNLWLSEAALLERFDRFAYQNPILTAFWIRKYIVSNVDHEVKLFRAEKAYVLLQILPEELAEEVVNNITSPWKQILKTIPRRPEETTSAESGLVLTQFLSHYYNIYDQHFTSKTSLN